MKLIILSRTKLSDRQVREAIDLHSEGDAVVDQYVNLYPWLKLTEVKDELAKILPGAAPLVYLPRASDIAVNVESLWLKQINNMIADFKNNIPGHALATKLQDFIAYQLREGTGCWGVLGKFIISNHIEFDFVAVDGKPSFVEMLYLNAFKPDVTTSAKIGNIEISKKSDEVAVSFKVDGQHNIEVIGAYRDAITALQHVRDGFVFLAEVYDK